MKIKRNKRYNVEKIRVCRCKRTIKATIIKSNSRRIGGRVMIELTKPLSYGFVVREDKVEDFLNHKRDRSKLEKVLRKASRLRKNMGVHE